MTQREEHNLKLAKVWIENAKEQLKTNKKRIIRKRAKKLAINNHFKLINTNNNISFKKQHEIDLKQILKNI